METHMKQISFFVSGIPRPSGSKRGFFIPKLKRVIITDANPNSKDWKIDVKHAAQAAYDGPLLDGPLHVYFRFFMLRPKGHYGSGKNAAVLKESAPEYPTGKPDVLKLARGVEDALSGIIYVDDCRIVTELLDKRYGDKPGVEVVITPL